MPLPQPVIFGDPSPIFVRAILIALAEKGVTAVLTEELGQARLGSGDWLSCETAIGHGGFVVRGTETILRYVDEALPGPRLQPGAPRQQARMNRALDVYFREAAPVLGGRILMRNLASAFTDEWISPDLPESLASAARHTIGRLSRVLDNGRFFAGGVFTLADAAVAPLFNYLMPLPKAESLIAPTSPLRCWWQRSRPRNGFLRNAAPERVRRTSKP